MQLEALFPQEIPGDFLVLGNVSKLGEGSAMIQVMWTNSSDSERGQLWDYPESLHATHPKHLSPEPYLSSLGFFLPHTEGRINHILPSSAEEKVPSTGTENPWTAQGLHTTACPCPLPSHPRLGHLPFELLVPCSGSGSTAGLCRGRMSSVLASLGLTCV